MVLIMGALLLLVSYRTITGYIAFDKNIEIEKDFGKGILNLILISGFMIFIYVGVMKIFRKSTIKNRGIKK